MDKGQEKTALALLRAGDVRGFDAIYEAFRPRLYGFLWRLARDPEVARDLLQETFLALAKNGARLLPDTQLAAWLFTVARNAWRSHRRSALLDVSRLLVTDDDHAVPSAEPGPDDSLDVARQAQRVERALVSLPEAHREVLLLVAVEGMSHDEAAAILGVSAETARQRLHRARIELARNLDRLQRRKVLP